MVGCANSACDKYNDQANCGSNQCEGDCMADDSPDSSDACHKGAINLMCMFKNKFSEGWLR